MTKIDSISRNRIQSGLSLAVIVVQCSATGGTIHTVRYAAVQGRPIFCPLLPGDQTDDPHYDGVSALLRSGRARTFSAANAPVLIRSLSFACVQGRRNTPHVVTKGSMHYGGLSAVSVLGRIRMEE